MKNKGILRSLAVLMAVTLMIPSGLFASADGGGTAVTVYNETVTVDGIDVEGESSALTVNAVGDTAEVTVNGDIELENSGYGTGINVNVNSGSTGPGASDNTGETPEAVVEVSGNVDVSIENGSATGVYATANSGSMDITIEGAVNVVEENTDDGSYRESGSGVTIYSNGGDVDVSIGEGITVSTDGSTATGLSSQANPDYRGSANEESSTVSIDVGGDVDVTAENAYATGVNLNTQSGANTETDVTIGGDVSVESDYSATGIQVYMDGEGDNLDLTVEGNVTAEGGDSPTGMRVQANRDGEATVHIGGDVSATTDKDNSQGTAVAVMASDGTAEVVIDGAVTADGGGIRAWSEGYWTYKGTEEYTGSTDEMMPFNPYTTERYDSYEVTNETTTYNDSAYRQVVLKKTSTDEVVKNTVYYWGELTDTGAIEGLPEYFSSSSTVSDEAGNPIKTVETYNVYDYSNGKRYEKEVEKDSEGNIVSTRVKAELEYEGDIDTLLKSLTKDENQNDPFPDWYSEKIGTVKYTNYYDDDGTRYYEIINYDLDGNVDSRNVTKYIYEYEGESDVTVTVGEGVDVSGEDAITGIEGNARHGSKLEIEVLKGGVQAEATGEDGSAVGIYLENNSSEINLTVNGDVTASGDIAIALRVIAEEEAETNVEITGDVTGDFRGIEIDVDKDSQANILVDGIVSGSENAILLGTDTVLDNVSITVWQVLESEDGNLVERVDKVDDEGEITYKADTEAEKSLQYIIRISQPDIISTVGTTEENGYQVAKEGDTVYLKLNIPDGYEVAEAWQNEGQTISLLQDSKGDYYLAVPRGGGVTLSVKLQEIPVVATPTPAPTAEPTAEPTATPAPVVAASAEATAEPIVTAVETTTVMSDEEIANAISDLLTKNGVDIEADVSVITGADGKRTVVIAPSTQDDVTEENTVLTLTMPADLVQTLSEQDVTDLKMVNNDGTAEVNMEISVIMEELDKRPGAQLVVECESAPEIATEIVEQLDEKYSIVNEAMITVRVMLVDEDGTETPIGTGKFTVTLFTEYQEGMKILFIDADGNAVETEAIWVEATDTEPGHWEVPYLGNGSYLPVIEK